MLYDATDRGALFIRDTCWYDHPAILDYKTTKTENTGILQVLPEEEEETILQTKVNYQKGGRQNETFHHQAHSITDDETSPRLHQPKERG